MIFAITGVRGVGKSTVINKTLEKFDTDFTLIKFGDFMLEIAEDERYANTRKELLELNKDDQKEIQEKATKKIKEIKEGPLILDTHCTVHIEQGYLPGMPKWVLETLSPDYIVIIEADPSEILVRRMKERQKFDDIETEEAIQSHQDVNRAISQAYSTISGSLVQIIKNHDGKQKEPTNNLQKILKQSI